MDKKETLEAANKAQLAAFEALRAHIELAEAQINVHQVLLATLLSGKTSPDPTAIRDAFMNRIEPMSHESLPAEYRAQFIREFEAALPADVRVKVFPPSGHFED